MSRTITFSNTTLVFRKYIIKKGKTNGSEITFWYESIQIRLTNMELLFLMSFSNCKLTIEAQVVLIFLPWFWCLDLTKIKMLFLTLSWRRPLSYRNQSIGFYMITASVIKGWKTYFSLTNHFIYLGIFPPKKLLNVVVKNSNICE